MSQNTNRPILGISFAIIGFAAFSYGDALAKWFASEGFSAYQISFIYAVFSVVTLLLFSKQLGGLKKTLKTQQKKKHFLRSLLNGPTGAINFYAFSVLPLANAYAVIFLAPFLTALLAVIFLKEKISKQNWILIALGFTGVLVAMRPDIYGFSMAVGLLVITALFTAGRNILVKQMGDQETPLSLALYPMVSILVFMAVPALMTWTPPSLAFWTIFALAGVGVAVGALLTSLSFRYAATAIAAPFHYTQLIWAALFGALFFEGFPDIWTLTGCAIVALSGIGLVRLKKS